MVKYIFVVRNQIQGLTGGGRGAGGGQGGGGVTPGQKSQVSKDDGAQKSNVPTLRRTKTRLE